MSEQQFEPAVLALLQEIAKDPRASLLRIPKAPLLRYMGRPEETISPHGSHLTKAEKHLVTAYREQAARVLVEACILRLKEDPQIFSTIQPDGADLRARAHALSSRVRAEERPLDALRALAHGTETPVSGMAVAALLLAPSELALNVLALAHQAEGNVQASIRVLGKAFDGASSFHQRAQAYENMARACDMQQRFGEALEFNYRASVTDVRKVRFLVWCLTSAIQAGDEARAIESIGRLEEHPQDADLPDIVRRLRLGRKRDSWSPTRGSLRVVANIRRHLTEKSGDICGAFL
jgi:hypothetical protein